MPDLTSQAVLDELHGSATEVEREKNARHFRGSPDSAIMGVRMKTTFDTAKAYRDLPLGEVERLLDSRYYEARMVAVAILDFKTRARDVTEDDRRAWFELYLRRHDRIDTWDLVDRSAPRVLGWYLLDKSRTPLFELAQSDDRWRRRSAITAAFWIIRAGDLEDPLALATLLLHDRDEYVNKSVGVALREIGRVDHERLTGFLRDHPDMPAVTRRYALELTPRELRAAI